jgi:hypothetical protein
MVEAEYREGDCRLVEIAVTRLITVKRFMMGPYSDELCLSEIPPKRQNVFEICAKAKRMITQTGRSRP